MDLVNEFYPNRFWRNPHLQTIWPLVCRPRRAPRLTRQRLELADGDFLDLDWLIRPEQQQPILLLIHGLEGNADSHYIRRMLLQAQHVGQAVVVMHQRSCSGEMNRLLRSYHSGASDDIAAVVATLQQHYPQSPLWAVGYSLGGNQLAKYLGETATSSGLERAAVVSAPLELAACAKRMEAGFSRIYQRRLLKQMQQKTEQKLAMFPQFTLPQPVTSLNTFYQFDDVVTAPTNGFDDAPDYYRRASGKPYIAQIETPTLLLHALDDPFMTEAVVPEQIAPAVTMELHPYGGHVGFIAGGWPWAPKFYLEQRLFDFFNNNAVQPN
ncbi:hydrolase [Ferrimonas lipolytica]|uniref:Hydrolase n=1 Tax=Ferrimonas lipolytica TaxID=2724191 RepID=A0A6H1UHQ3_9GAMM|nr:hydrolase [Ferrimonas lipolytica]QIZ77843.1 hydrolase [Ferrimonas lipolytica]